MRVRASVRVYDPTAAALPSPAAPQAVSAAPLGARCCRPADRQPAPGGADHLVDRSSMKVLWEGSGSRLAPTGQTFLAAAKRHPVGAVAASTTRHWWRSMFSPPPLSSTGIPPSSIELEQETGEPQVRDSYAKLH